MDSRVRFAVAGEPIEHSLSPELFALVAEHLGLEWDMPRKIKASTPEEMFIQLEEGFEKPDSEFVRKIKEVTKKVTEPLTEFIPNGDTFVTNTLSKSPNMNASNCFVSITSPLKHQFVECDSVNCVMLTDSAPENFNSDGLGFVTVARHFGIFPENEATLGLKGGGSTALATAMAWTTEGGKLNLYEGRRKLDSKFYEFEGSGTEDIFVNYDNSEFKSNVFGLNPVYDGTSIGSITNNILDGTWLLVAQHLVAWHHLFNPTSDLPSLGLLMSKLAEFALNR